MINEQEEQFQQLQQLQKQDEPQVSLKDLRENLKEGKENSLFLNFLIS